MDQTTFSVSPLDEESGQPQPVGKSVADRLYVHISALLSLTPEQAQSLQQASDLLDASEHRFNVLKFGIDGWQITLLNYPDFEAEAFPILREAWTIDLRAGVARYRTYAESQNPPILHRKELLVAKDFPRYATFAQLTKNAEAIGLFTDPVRIGFRQSWERLLEIKGYRVVDFDLVPIGNREDFTDAGDPTAFEGVARHLTALTRSRASAPMQILERHGFLDGARSIFDYGCGRGGDVRWLKECGVHAQGWDPHFAPDESTCACDLVNLGFVVNVIEDFEERQEAIRRAFVLANELLVVSVMLEYQDSQRGIPYADGVLTSRRTFQKYFSQAELRTFVATTLDEEPISVAPGIVFVFKDKQAEQRFLYGRVQSRSRAVRLAALYRPPRVPGPPRAPKQTRQDRLDAQMEKAAPLVDALLAKCLELGRPPDKAEFELYEAVREAFGSLDKALRLMILHKPNVAEMLAAARQLRADSLRVYLAGQLFEKRRAYKSLEPVLQRDIRGFFSDYRSAMESGRELIYSLGVIENVGRACHEAAEKGLGWLEEGQSLQLHTSMVERLPPILRTYVAVGTVLYGDVTGAALVKIHIRSGKLTLMQFDDFTGSALPKMTQRVKLDLRNQDMQIFDYVAPYDPPYLYRKSRFVDEEIANYAEQVAFEEALDKLALLNFDGFGPSAEAFDALLSERRYVVDGMQLMRSREIPAADQSCGKNFTYRQLIECGDTWSCLRPDNLPREPGSYSAMLDLTVFILDPLIEYFGMVSLTYGFCSSGLARKISGRIAPRLDQHAAHEKKRDGSVVCERLGAAVDIVVDDEDMEEVARWVISNLPFDRLYFYGPSKPIHVSYGPQHSRAAYRMVEGKSGALLPRAF